MCSFVPRVAAVRSVREGDAEPEWRSGDRQLLYSGKWDFRMVHLRDE